MRLFVLESILKGVADMIQMDVLDTSYQVPPFEALFEELSHKICLRMNK